MSACFLVNTSFANGKTYGRIWKNHEESRDMLPCYQGHALLTPCWSGVWFWDRLGRPRDGLTPEKPVTGDGLGFRVGDRFPFSRQVVREKSVFRTCAFETCHRNLLQKTPCEACAKTHFRAKRAPLLLQLGLRAGTKLTPTQDTLGP